MTTEKIDKVPALVRWLAYHAINKLPIRVDIPNMPPMAGVVIGYKEPLLVLKTTENDAVVVNLTLWTALSSEYMSGIPDPYPGFEPTPKKSES